MTAARSVLDELAVIGAEIEPAGDRLILRAGSTAIPAALVSRVRKAKADLLSTLTPRTDRADVCGDEDKEHDQTSAHRPVKDRSSESFIVQWLNQHPAPSIPGRCAWCGKSESPTAVVLPFGTEPGTHAWLHAECWPSWHRARRADAVAELRATSPTLDGPPSNDHDR